jgi:23S rRNA (cytidine2498-2'-O)-methyltransferase
MPRSVAVALCRPGFEPEAACDLRSAAGAIDVASSRDSGFVTAGVDAPPGRFDAALASAPPVFARTVMLGRPAIELPRSSTPTVRPDRITPLAAEIAALAGEPGQREPWRSVWVEYPDTNEGKALAKLARVLESALTKQLSGRLHAGARRRLHVFLPDGGHAFVGTSDAATTHWPLGIPRIARPRGAPSRSAQKLVEAFVVFLGDRERDRVRAGQRAVDLGAAPGGWSWVLASRGLRVTAVDNGPLKGEIASDPLVTHLRVDGVRWRPRRRVDWLTCDIVEQPSRIADLVGRWVADGLARHAIFNLKLPMKRRYDALRECEARIAHCLERSSVEAALSFRQLYHDREEVTGYLEALA